MNALTVLDLFAGAGGLTQGFHDGGHGAIRTVRAVEMDASAAATYEANHGEGIVFAGPIEEWLASDEAATLKVDIVVGGPPCQGFSQLGKQEIDDERNFLWEKYAETIRRVDPDYFVVENVATFLKSPQFTAFRQATLPGGDLSAWTFEAKILNAADYGAPQARKRAVLIGHRRSLPFPGWPPVTRDEHMTVRQAFAAHGNLMEIPGTPRPGLPTRARGKLAGPFSSRELHVMRSYTALSISRFAYIKEGENRFKLPLHLQAECWKKHRTGSGDVMGRMWWDRPSVTIRTEFFKPEKGRYLHPKEHRALTHWEAARLQGFPDDYQWFGSRTAIARQIGNAVPIPLGRAIAEQLLKAAQDEAVRRAGETAA